MCAISSRQSAGVSANTEGIGMQSLRVLFLVGLVFQAQADVTISFADSDGDPIGTLVQTIGPNIQLLTDDGYLVIVNQSNGTLHPIARISPWMFFYESNNCTGQAYVSLPDPERFYYGGQIIQVGHITGDSPQDDLASKGFGRVEWGTMPIDVSGKSYLNPATTDGCVALEKGEESPGAIPITEIDRTEYGIDLIDKGMQGYKPPLSRTVSNTHDAVFCSSFESCPTQ
jgi:hypothetical protein